MGANIDHIKKRIFEIVEADKDSDKASHYYDMMILTAIIVGVLPLTIREANLYTKIIDVTTVLLFTIDYILRIFTSDYKMGVKSYKAYLFYAFTPMAIVDLLSLVPIIDLFIPGNSLFGIFRVFRVLRMLKLVRYSKTMTTITNVLRRVKKELGAVLILTLLYIASSALTIFQIEPDIFNNFFDALYWATISITTIGYGDISPITSVGKFITMFSALVGVAVIALPSGIITAAYMDEIKKKKSKLEL